MSSSKVEEGERWGEIIHKVGDICDAKESFIVHQVNCVSKGSAGLAKQLFARFPWANLYASNWSRRVGRAIIFYGQDGKPGIINLCGQYLPGRPRRGETKEQRLKWFTLALNSVTDSTTWREKNLSLAVPFGIGCGLAGGDWNDYYPVLQEFAKNNPTVKVVVYTYNG